jgi:two-component system OmpR family response regulator
VSRFKPHLMVLDVMLPDMEGFEVAAGWARSGPGVPIIFLTARDATEDKVRGLTLGGDDYMTKPFSLEELVARIRADPAAHAGDAEADRAPEFEDLEMDEESPTRCAARRADRADRDRVQAAALPHAQPAPGADARADPRHVWNYDFGGDANVVETYISYLRKKLDATGRR